MRYEKTGAVLAAAALAALAAGCASTKTVPGPSVTITETMPVPGPTQTVTASPPPPAAGTTLLNQSGSGTAVTPSFTASGSGDYTVYWTFSGNDTDGVSGGDNFIVNENNANPSNMSSGDLPNDIATSGSGSTEITGDTGTHSFNVQATGDWTIKVVSAP